MFEIPPSPSLTRPGDTPHFYPHISSCDWFAKLNFQPFLPTCYTSFKSCLSLYAMVALSHRFALLVTFCALASLSFVVPAEAAVLRVRHSGHSASVSSHPSAGDSRVHSASAKVKQAAPIIPLPASAVKKDAANVESSKAAHPEGKLDAHNKREKEKAHRKEKVTLEAFFSWYFSLIIFHRSNAVGISTTPFSVSVSWTSGQATGWTVTNTQVRSSGLVRSKLGTTTIMANTRRL